MILAVNIGNSHITFGGYEGNERVFDAQIESDAKRTKYQYMADIKNIAQLFDIDLEKTQGAVIGSVVPELTEVLKESIRKMCNAEPIVVGPGVKSGLDIRIENPAQLGADIVAGAVAAAAKYKPPIIICNFATATVISVIDKAGIFRGAIIAAGVGTTLDGFTKRTALLPHVNMEAPKRVIGTNSIASMQSGLIFGTSAMIDGLVERIENEISDNASVVATGELSDVIIKCCKTHIEKEEHLIIDGLKIIYDRNLK